jgi:hypothetical protein
LVFEFLLDSSASEARNAAWSVEVHGPAGVTADGVTLQVDPSDGRHVFVTVDPSVVGDVVLFASYVDANSALVLGTPMVVVSRPAGAEESGIELRPSAATLAPGARVPLTIWVDYTNGMSSMPFVGPGQGARFSSSSPSVVSVDTNGVARAYDYGAATWGWAGRGDLRANAGAEQPRGRGVVGLEELDCVRERGQHEWGDPLF